MDIKKSKIPTIKDPIDISVNGIEKYLVSLNVVITIIENIMPKQIDNNPGIPRNLRGCFNAINSINDTITSLE